MHKKFTEKAKQAVLKAQEYVRNRQQQDVQIAHLMKGMLEVDESVVGYLLKKLGVNISDLNNKLIFRKRLALSYRKLRIWHMNSTMNL